MRVLFAAMGGVNGGVEKKLIRLCQHFARSGHQPSVLLLRKTPAVEAVLTRELVPWTSDVLPNGYDMAEALAAARARLGFELQANPVDAVVAFGAPATCVAIPAAATYNPAARRVAAVVGDVGPMWRQPPEPFGPRSLSERLSFALGRAHVITVVAEHLVADVHEFVSEPPQIVVIPNGVDIPQWRADPLTQPPTAVCVANFLSVKGHDLLGDALHHVREPMTVILCGEGPLRNDTLQRFQQLPAHITVVAPEPPSDVQAYLAASQFSLQPSRSEGHSHAVLESLAAGLPVVGFACPGNSAVVTQGAAGVLVPETDRRALAMVIDQMAANPPMRARLATGARERAHHYPWSTTLERYEAIVQ